MTADFIILKEEKIHEESFQGSGTGSGCLPVRVDGEVDDIPEQAFLNVGTIEEAISKGEQMLAALNM